MFEKLILNYPGTKYLGNKGKRLFIERHLVNGLLSTHIPNHIYGIVTEIQTERTNASYLDVVNVDFLLSIY